jgi:ABC-type nickel/cobalt efflux system permease component RcnA
MRSAIRILLAASLATSLCGCLVRSGPIRHEGRGACARGLHFEAGACRPDHHDRDDDDHDHDRDRGHGHGHGHDRD